MKIRPLRLLGPVLVLAIFALAIWLLVGQLRHYRLSDIVDSLREIPLSRVFFAFVLTVLNYGILVGYDVLAVHFVGVRLPLWKIALASFTGYACSYNIGATLAGASIRYRLYSAWGVPLGKLLQLLVILGLTFWFGVFALAGVVFLFFPLRIPPEQIVQICAKIPKLESAFHLLFADSRPFGSVLLLLAVLYIGLSALHKGTIKIFRWQLHAPPLKLSIYQVLIASADMLVAGWVLWVLFPVVKGGYMTVLAVYLVAYVLVVLSHVPGGWGVLETVIIGLLHYLELVPKAEMPQVIAGLVIFRVIYFLGPLLLAAVLLGINEWALQKVRWKAKLAEEEKDRPAEPVKESHRVGTES